MRNFEMNGIVWALHYVEPNDPNLVDRFDKRTVACTNPITKRIYISNNLGNTAFAKKVLIHELTHAAMVSYGFTDYLNKSTHHPMMLEEHICNFIADNCSYILLLADTIK